MTRETERLVILKIGGSVVTQKSRKGVFIRRTLLKHIAREIVFVLRHEPSLKLIVVHGAGSAGHQLAKEYDLVQGAGNDAKKWKGSLLIRIANQKLNLAITEIFTSAGLRIVPVHTGSVVVQKDGAPYSFDTQCIDQALSHHCIPLLYGEMVFDTTLGMTICSGDVSMVHLARRYRAERMLYASDVDGVFDADPYVHTHARMIPFITLKDIVKNAQVSVSGSHHVDVTGGLYKKIIMLGDEKLPTNLKKVVLFNGLKKGTFTKAFTDTPPGTTILL